MLPHVFSVASSSNSEMTSNEDDDAKFEFEQVEEVRVHSIIYIKYLIEFHAAF